MINPPPKIIDTPTGIQTLLANLTNLPNNPPSLYIDLEGINLGRHGSISILQIFHLPSNEIYLVDIHTLGSNAFTTPSPRDPTVKKTPTTLKTILESPTIQKAFFDVRNDSDALYSHFGIYLSGIQDIQLLELATRTFTKQHVNGLAKCIDRDAGLSLTERLECSTIKEKGKRLFAPELGGSYEVFNVRPMRKDIVLYCAQDVRILSRLWNIYDGSLLAGWRERVEVAVRERVDVCLLPVYSGKGRERALAPEGWTWAL
ncbi:ribonuclease H-like domain-containing protein [Aspergillus varians]